MIDNQLVINKDLVMIFTCLSEHDSYHIYFTVCRLSINVDLDETPQNAASNQDLHYLPLIQQFLDTALGSKLYLLKF